MKSEDSRNIFSITTSEKSVSVLDGELKSEDSRNIFSMKETMYDYPLFLEGDVVVSRGKAVRYRVFEITENRNE